MQAVQEYSQRKLAFPAIQSPRSRDLLSGDEVLISEADLEGYHVCDDTKDLIIPSPKISAGSPMIVKHLTISPIEGDEVLVTEADLEGYETFMNSWEGKNMSEQTAPTRTTIRWLSCLCSSIKFSAGSHPVASRFSEIDAC